MDKSETHSDGVFTRDNTDRKLRFIQTEIARLPTKQAARNQFSKINQPNPGSSPVTVGRGQGFQYAALVGYGGLVMPTGTIGGSSDTTSVVFAQKGRYFALLVIGGDHSYLLSQSQGARGKKMARKVIKVAKRAVSGKRRNGTVISARPFLSVTSGSNSRRPGHRRRFPHSESSDVLLVGVRHRQLVRRQVKRPV